jgi:TPP-dependent 2-oxoacid decarboxylase
MTGPEISQCQRHELNPIVILFNNSRWEMLQAFFPKAGYNETVGWPFARLAELWGGHGFEVSTPKGLRGALAAGHEEARFCLIEVKLERGDISPILRGFVEGFKRRVDTPENLKATYRARTAALVWAFYLHGLVRRNLGAAILFLDSEDL